MIFYIQILKPPYIVKSYLIQVCNYFVYCCARSNIFKKVSLHLIRVEIDENKGLRHAQ